MEEQDLSAVDAKTYILEQLRKQGDFAEIMDAATLEGMIDAVMALDEAFMQQSGANDGAVYDDDAAYDFMHEKMVERFPAYKTYMLRLVEDYMDYNEQYLESLGLIDWA